MRAAVFRQGDFVVDTVPEPVLHQGQALVRTTACGICGSDLHAAAHTAEFAALSARAGARWTLDPARDTVFGHEFAGEILDYGPRTTGTLKAGTVVTSMPLTIAQNTVIGLGYNSDAPGGFAERLPLAERMLLAVPNGLPAAHASLTEPMAVGWHAVEHARLAPLDLPMVIGCGPVGLAVIAALKIRAAHPIVAADFSPARRALALTMGADVVIDPAETSPYSSWSALATPADYDPARFAQLLGIGGRRRPAVWFECVGVPGIIQQMIEGAPDWARIVVVGVCMQTDRFEPFLGIVKQTSLQFVLAYNDEEFARSLHHIAEGLIDVAPMITATIGLDEVAGAFAELASPDRHAKIVVEPFR